MKKIKIKCVDFWPNAEKDMAIFWDTLRQRYELEFCEEPDYLFYSCFGNENLKYTDCIKICVHWENLTPDFNLCDYALAFDLMTYGDRYLRYPYAMRMLDRPELYDREKRSAAQENRTRFCSFVYSNNEADPMRGDILKAVAAYKSVDCGGKVGHNIDIPEHEGWGWQRDRLEFEKQYKFSIACENSSTPGYVTEKIFISLAAGTIPIYWGDPTIKQVVNEKAFINVSDYPTLDALVKRIRKIDENDDLYQEMIAQPVFQPGWNCETEQAKLQTFLYNIFDQPKAQAYRRNMAYWGKRYQQHMLSRVINENSWFALCEKRQKNPVFRAAKKVQGLIKK